MYQFLHFLILVSGFWLNILHVSFNNSKFFILLIY